VDGLEVLAGGVVLGLMPQHAGVHLHDVVQRVDEVDPFVQDHRLDLAEERRHAHLSCADHPDAGGQDHERTHGDQGHRDQSEPLKPSASRFS
jgi:hypothetical protein